MKAFITMMAFLPALFLLTGCQTTPTIEQVYSQHMDADNQTTRDAFHDHVKAGVITQSTIYPHHFVQHTPTLNGLGGRDLDILADHYINDVMPVSKPVNVVDDVHVYFDYDKSDIRSDGTDVLKSAIATLKANPDTDIIITGRADVRGSNEYNDALGNRRAGSVSAYLKANGVDPNRVRIVSRGEMDALAPESDEAGMQKDRNAHFIVAEVNQYPLPLNVRKAGASDNLYQARKRQVLAYLKEKGVNTDLLKIEDGMAGGPGLQSEEVFLIVTDTDESTTTSTGLTIAGGTQ
jgi:outer membrane protein OmpA-like peptidoglycan-associated protein